MGLRESKWHSPNEVHPWSWKIYNEDVKKEALDSFPIHLDKIMSYHEKHLPDSYEQGRPWEWDDGRSPWEWVERQTERATKDKAFLWLEVQHTVLNRWHNEALQEHKQEHTIRYNCPKKTPCVCPVE